MNIEKKYSYILSLLTIFTAVYILFSINYSVQTLEYQVAEVDRMIEKEEKNLKILRAEYAHLQSPARIAAFASKFLNLSPIRVSQIETTSPDLIVTLKPSSFVSSSSSRAWRYKRSIHEYVKSSNKRGYSQASK